NGKAWRWGKRWGSEVSGSSEKKRLGAFPTRGSNEPGRQVFRTIADRADGETREQDPRKDHPRVAQERTVEKHQRICDGVMPLVLSVHQHQPDADNPQAPKR